MDTPETVLEARRDVALYETFALPKVNFGFTTIKDDESPEFSSWIFFGDQGGDEDTEGQPYVAGKVIAVKNSLNVLLYTWFPQETFTFFTAFE